MSLDQFYNLMQIVLVVLVPGAIMLFINQGLELRAKYKRWEFRKTGGK